MVFFIHGGGWLNGDKVTFNNAGQYLPAGISVVSINYRLITQAEADKLVPPVKGRRRMRTRVKAPIPHPRSPDVQGQVRRGNDARPEP